MICHNVPGSSSLHLPIAFERSAPTVTEHRSDYAELLVAKFARKKNKVMKLVSAIQKTGHNEVQDYNFVEEAEVVKLLRSALMKAGLCMSVSASDMCLMNMPATETGECANYLLKMTFTFIDTETGYCQTYPWLGMGADKGDKALYRAYTGAVKYFLLKSFLLPTDDDVERTGAVRKQYVKNNVADTQSELPPMDANSAAIMSGLEEHFQKLTPEHATFDRNRFHAAVWEYFHAWPSVNAAAKRIKEVLDVKSMIVWG